MKAARSKAVDEVAEATGKSPSAVRGALARAEKAEKKDEAKASKGEPSNWAEMAKRMMAAQQKMQGAQAELNKARSAVDGLGNERAKDWALSSIDKWSKDAHELSFGIRYNVPAGDCPGCGGSGCKMCGKIGFVSKRRLAEIEAAK